MLFFIAWMVFHIFVPEVLGVHCCFLCLGLSFRRFVWCRLCYLCFDVLFCDLVWIPFVRCVLCVCLCPFGVCILSMFMIICLMDFSTWSAQYTFLKCVVVC